MKAWHEFLQFLEQSMGKETIQKWLFPLKIEKFDAANLYLKAENSFQIVWFEEHIRPLVKEKFKNQNGRPIYVHLASDTDPAKKEKTHLSSFEISPDAINPHATFLSFIKNENNELIYTFFRDLLGFSDKNLPLATFNPILIHGPSGSGKTHLLMSVANRFQEMGYLVFYVRAETFTSHVIQAIRLGLMQEFRKAYRNSQILLVDDIHLLAKKNATQEEFFHTFNTLHQMGCQIILSSKDSPRQMTEIEPRLISRFEWGLTFKLEKLQKSDLPLFLKKKLELFQRNICSSITDFLLEKFSSPSSLNKALEALFLHEHLAKEELNLDLAKKLLEPHLEEEKDKEISFDKIIKSTADFFGLTPDDILGKSQKKEVAYPRKVAIYFLRERLQLPYMKIGELLKRDHSTIISSHKQIKEALEEKDNETTASYQEIAYLLEKCSK